MLELTSNGRTVALDPGTTVQLELNSPLFDEELLKGDYSFSFSVPAEPNGEVYGYPELPESDVVPAAGVPGTLADDGQVVLSGTQRVRTATATRYSVNLFGGLSQLAADLNGRKIASFAYGGERRVSMYADTNQTPGILLHANDTVAHPERYDYVFAPILNDGAWEDAPAGVLINPWTYLGTPAGGLPAGGTFYQEPGLNDGVPLLCPLPWLRYVLASIFTELGLQVDAATFLPGERGQLLIGSNAVLPAPVHRFHLADVLPDLTVVELLTKLRTAAGIVCLVNTADRTVRTVYYDEVLASPAYMDLTALSSGARQLERADPQGLTLTYSTDSDDALTKDVGMDFSGQRLGSPVARLSDLPASTPVPLVPGLGFDVPLAEVRLVTTLDTWYKSTVNWDSALGAPSCTLTWAVFAPNFRPLDVRGGGQAIEQGVAATVLKTGTSSYHGDALPMLVPAMQQPVFRAGAADDTSRSSALRLWFWRGLQRSIADPVKLYPLATPYNRDAYGLRIGECSLKLDGPDGTYERWLKAWLLAKTAPCVVKETLALSPEQLAQHDPARKVRIGSTDYLVRKLAPTMPLTKRVPVELFRV